VTDCALCVPCILGDHARCEGFAVVDGTARVPCTCRSPHSVPQPASITASRTPPGSEDRQHAGGAEAYRCPPCAAGNHQACVGIGDLTACDCARREHAGTLADAIADELRRLDGLRLPIPTIAHRVAGEVQRWLGAVA
jgi:hypothetical protein